MNFLSYQMLNVGNYYRGKCYGKKRCPPKLEDFGKQIATKCHGLPLAVVVIAAILEKCEMKEHLWQNVARSLSPVISKDPNTFGNILELSYKHLPMHLKPCFLYFGAFQEDEKSLIQVVERSSLGRVKTCNVHDLLHDMCTRKGERENFLKEVQRSILCSFELVKVLDWSRKNFSIPDLTRHEQLVNLRLESLRVTFHPYCVIQSISLPLNIRKLTLLCFCMSWKQVKIIGRLPNLVVLKLRVGSFEGRQWNTTKGGFQQLKVLKLSWVDNTEWNAPGDPFPRLQRLVLRHCNYLENIPTSFCYIPTLQMIEVHDCKQSVKECAREILQEQRDMGNEELQVIITP
ncbi:NB-ARC domain-containing protein [Abeliophyllum distichum]|uniref:NB-ARC domain-containing protein n=1 Tax=Abeliophyllum distichum TaxID=126358 RepID=A0ABD1RYJ9_9LAMI